MPKFYCPTVHLNGTSKEALLAQWRAVHNAAQILEKALLAATPHDRDFYIQSPDPIQEAVMTHRERLGAVRKVMDEAMLIWQGIDAQGENRRRGPS